MPCGWWVPFEQPNPQKKVLKLAVEQGDGSSRGSKLKKFLGFTFALSCFITPLAFGVCSDSSQQEQGTRAEPPGVTAPGFTPGVRNEATNRWLELNVLSFSFRYRSEASNVGYHYFENGQQRSLIDGRVKLDAEGKYAVHFHVSSGRTFNWSYSDEIGPDFDSRTSNGFSYLSPLLLKNAYAAIEADPSGYGKLAGVPSRGWEMYFRQLYFSAAPVKQVAIEYGSLGIEKGEGTEATTYDDDGYVTGERLRLMDPRHLFFDQVSVTYGYEGDIFQPNFFDRGERLGQSNYHQFLVAKHVGSRIHASGDYTFDKGTHTIHEAVLAGVKEMKALDGVRLETYQRLNDKLLSGATFHAGQGFAVTGTKTFFKQFQLDAGAAHIDQDYGVLTGDRVLAFGGFSMNGDAFLTGSRLFVRANWKVNPYINLFGYYTHEVTDPPPGSYNFNKEAANFGATVDFKSMLTRFHVL